MCPPLFAEILLPGKRGVAVDEEVLAALADSDGNAPGVGVGTFLVLLKEPLLVEVPLFDLSGGRHEVQYSRRLDSRAAVMPVGAIALPELMTMGQEQRERARPAYLAPVTRTRPRSVGV